jgi:hypothetical protein
VQVLRNTDNFILKTAKTRNPQTGIVRSAILVDRQSLPSLNDNCLPLNDVDRFLTAVST